VNNVILPYLKEIGDRRIYAFEHTMLRFGDYKFIVRYSQPYFGFLSHNTRVWCDDEVNPYSYIFISPVWEDQKVLDLYKEEKYLHHERLMKEFIEPHFKPGYWRAYQKGDIFRVHNMDFHVDSTNIEKGYVCSKNTRIELLLGVTKSN
jgi:hypothetical protein